MIRKDFDFYLAKQVHNNFYDYSKVVCLGSKKKVVITCPLHGDFSQTPYCHIIRKQGCSKCQYEQQKQNLTFSKEEFTCNANKVHNGKYNYEETLYVNSYTKVKIKCNLHGEFTQLPLNHVNHGKGCPKCKSITLAKLNLVTQEEFINHAKSIHGSKYDYSKVIYIGMKHYVDIICPQHGTFSQRAGDHIHSKSGCPICGYNVSKAEIAWLDSLGVPKSYRQKIITINDIRYKVDAYDKANKTVYEYFGSFWHGNPVFYNPNDINPKNGIKFGDLYQSTLAKIKNIETAGYKLIYEWGK